MANDSNDTINGLCVCVVVWLYGFMVVWLYGFSCISVIMALI